MKVTIAADTTNIVVIDASPIGSFYILYPDAVVDSVSGSVIAFVYLPSSAALSQCHRDDVHRYLRNSRYIFPFPALSGGCRSTHLVPCCR